RSALFRRQKTGANGLESARFGERQHGERCRRIAHEAADVGGWIALLVQRGRSPLPGGAHLVAREPIEPSRDLRVSRRLAGVLEGQRREAGGVAVAPRVERAAVEPLPRAERSEAPAP